MCATCAMHICACVRSSSVGCVIRVPLLDLAYTYLLTYLLDLAVYSGVQMAVFPGKSLFSHREYESKTCRTTGEQSGYLLTLGSGFALVVGGLLVLWLQRSLLHERGRAGLACAPGPPHRACRTSSPPGSTAATLRARRFSRFERRPDFLVA